MSSKFKPVAGIQPVPYTDPRAYHALGTDIQRGKPEFIMSRSALSDFGTCPRKWLLGAPRKETAAMRDGSLVDTLLLSPNTFDATYILHPETYPVEKPTKADPRTEKPWIKTANFCKEWEQSQKDAGKIVCGSDDVVEADKAIKRIYEDPIFEQLLKHSDRQVLLSAEWHDDATGLVVPFKVLVDILPHSAGPFGSMLADFKRTAEATPDRWQRQAFDQEHYYQAALYLDIVNAATGLSYAHFGHVISESEPPYEPARRMLSSDFMELGRMLYRRDLHLYCHCLKMGTWPGYEDMPEDPKFPVVQGWGQVEVLPWMIKKHTD